MHLNFHRFGDSHQSIERDGFLCPLDRADVNRMKIGFLRELFLTETGLLAIAADRFTQDSAILRDSRHSPLKKQEPGGTTTTYRFNISACLSKPAMGRKKLFGGQDVSPTRTFGFRHNGVD